MSHSDDIRALIKSPAILVRARILVEGLCLEEVDDDTVELVALALGEAYTDGFKKGFVQGKNLGTNHSENQP